MLWWRIKTSLLGWWYDGVFKKRAKYILHSNFYSWVHKHLYHMKKNNNTKEILHNFPLQFTNWGMVIRPLDQRKSLCTITSVRESIQNLVLYSFNHLCSNWSPWPLYIPWHLCCSYTFFIYIFLRILHILIYVLFPVSIQNNDRQ